MTKKTSKVLQLDGTVIRLVDVVHLVTIIAAAISLWFFITGRVTLLEQKHDQLDKQVDRMEGKLDDVGDRLSKIEGALGVRPQASNQTNRSTPTPNTTLPNTSSSPITVNTAPSTSDSSASFQPQPIPTPSPIGGSVGGAVDTIKETTDSIFKQLPIRL